MNWSSHQDPIRRHGRIIPDFCFLEAILSVHPFPSHLPSGFYILLLPLTIPLLTYLAASSFTFLFTSVNTRFSFPFLLHFHRPPPPSIPLSFPFPHFPSCFPPSNLWKTFENLHWPISRYIMAEQKKAEEFGITEDDVSEIRQDINKFRWEKEQLSSNPFPLDLIGTFLYYLGNIFKIFDPFMRTLQKIIITLAVMFPRNSPWNFLKIPVDNSRHFLIIILTDFCAIYRYC